MAIPDYQSIMLPLLKHLSDQRERGNEQTVKALADEFGLTTEERKRLLASGQQTVFANRIGWAKVYLKKAGLIESRRRGLYKITQRGTEVLKQNPQSVDNRFLMRFPDFVTFIRPKKSPPGSAGSEKGLGDDKTPEEYLEYGYQEIRRQLADEILRRIKECPSDFFEKLVVDLLLRMGYGGSRHDAGRSIGKSGDGGIDGIIKEDKLGLDAVYIQAKRWENNVSRPEVQKFAGALQGVRARKGILITSSDFTKEAEDYVKTIENKIVLLNGTQLAELMIDHDIGVTRVAAYELKRIDSDYFTSD
ncbi:MAG: restriction endonuclease [Chloroflexi bacterium]|nr:restriction endonuclease [Chloroflexota bacterium]